MAREGKRVELRTVDDSPAPEVPVIRLETEETGTRAATVRLKISSEEPNVSQRLSIPDRAEYETRTHQPGIEAIIEADLPNPSLFENDWGNASTQQKHIPWGWFVLIGLLLSGAALWSLSQVREAGPQAKQEQTQTVTMLQNDAKEIQEASRLLARIETKIRRFFKTESVAARAQMARHPQRVTTLMAAYYAKEPLIPRTVVQIRRLEPLSLGPNTNFWLSVVELDNHKTSNLIIEVPPNEEPLVDWETLVCYQPMDWNTFASERPINTSFDFRVYLQADNFYSHEFADATKWTCFRLSAIGGDEPVFGYAKANEAVARNLTELLNQNRGRPCTVILRISIPEGLQSRSGVVIEKLVNPRWLYLDPPDSGS